MRYSSPNCPTCMLSADEDVEVIIEDIDVDFAYHEGIPLTDLMPQAFSDRYK